MHINGPCGNQPMKTSLLWKVALKLETMTLSAIEWKPHVHLNCDSTGSLLINLCPADCIIQQRPTDAPLLTPPICSFKLILTALGKELKGKD